MKYTVDITETEQAGYDFQSSITGEAVQDMIQRRVSEIAIAFVHDMKRVKVQDLVAKIQDDPDAYAEAITPIYDAKVAILEAEKAATEALLKEELPVLEVIK